MDRLPNQKNTRGGRKKETNCPPIDTVVQNFRDAGGGVIFIISSVRDILEYVS